MANVANFFKSKKFVLILLAVVIAGTGIIWAIIANQAPKFSSGIGSVPTPHTVSGNGSAAVMADNYLYFIGGCMETDSIKYGDNNYYQNGKIPDAGIYRVRIENNRPVLDYQFDNSYLDEESGTMKEYTKEDNPEQFNHMDNCTEIKDWNRVGKNSGIQCVVPKIAGHDTAAMWIFGDSLIYATPNHLRNSKGSLLNHYLNFYRVDLDGKHHELIYESKTADLQRENFTIWANADNNIYLLIAESGNEAQTYTLKKISVKNGAVTQIADNVKDFVFPTATQYRNNSNHEKLAQVYGGVMSYVYYTKDRDAKTDSNKGNLMYRYQINAANEPQLVGGKKSSFSVGYNYKPLAVTPLPAGGAQFVYSTTETTESADTFYHIVSNDNVDDESDYQTFAGNTLNKPDSSKVSFYANGYWSDGTNLYRYNITGGHIDDSDRYVYASDFQSVIAVMGNRIVLENSNNILIIDGNLQTAIPFGAVNQESANKDSGSSNALILPAAVLYQSYANGEEAGLPLIFMATNQSMQLHLVNKTNYGYLRIFA